MTLETPDYRVTFVPETVTIVLSGFLRLNGVSEYQPIMDYIITALESLDHCTLDLRELEFLNSSGISMLSILVVKVRESKSIKLTFLGTSAVLWQTRSLKNLKRLLPTLEIVLE